MKLKTFMLVGAIVMSVMVARFSLLSEGGVAAAFAPSSEHGAGLEIQSHLDSNFCIRVGDGATVGRSVTLAQCTVADVMRWTFTWNSDNTNLIVETQGMCLDGHYLSSRVGLPMRVVKCTTSNALHFTVSPAGHIIDVANNKCLFVPRAGAGARVFLVTCDSNIPNQVFQFR